MRKKAEQEAKKAKLEALEKKLDESSGGKKRRFDDTEYLEQSQEIVDNVKSAVTAGKSFPDFTEYKADQQCSLLEEEESQTE